MTAPVQRLLAEIAETPNSPACLRHLHMAEGYRGAFGQPNCVARASAFGALLARTRKHVYRYDLILGSAKGLYADSAPPEAQKRADQLVASFGARNFWQGFDYAAPAYGLLLEHGVGGLRRQAAESLARHGGDATKAATLRAMDMSLAAFACMAEGYAAAALAKADGEPDPVLARNLREAAAACGAVAHRPPSTFRQALQLVWLAHIAWTWEGRYAMALGRMDQYLLPYYERDLADGLLTPATTRELLAHALGKIAETGDIVNIALGGLKRDGSDATNALSHLFLDAVGDAGIPGPNLSARLHQKTPDDFLDACLRLIGTGIGYPALMNDGVNVPALRKAGYALEDCRDYAMVGCIENFMAGKQPPWSDGRFNAPLHLALALTGGLCPFTGGRVGPATPADPPDMESFMAAFRTQLEAGVAEYATRVANEGGRLDPGRHEQPFLSCLTEDCVARGLDVNNGGAVYPSAHGACCMGIATVADSLAAVEQVVYGQKAMSPARLREVLAADFAGCVAERAMLLAAPKYGNDDPRADRHAIWFVDTLAELFGRWRTHDGGPMVLLMAANVQNISAGAEVGATPDGRLARTPLSDAASAMRGMDRNGPTALAQSLARPDYTKVAGGSVVNVRFAPGLFRDPGQRARLAALVRVYLRQGGPEMQINCVSRELLEEARRRPEEHRDLVVRVSGFSAHYAWLDPKVQEDILARTEHA